MTDVDPFKEPASSRSRPALPTDTQTERDGFQLLADAWVMLAAAGVIGLAGYLSIPDPANLNQPVSGPHFVHATSDTKHGHGPSNVMPLCGDQSACIAQPTTSPDRDGARVDG